MSELNLAMIGVQKRISKRSHAEIWSTKWVAKGSATGIGHGFHWRVEGEFIDLIGDQNRGFRWLIIAECCNLCLGRVSFTRRSALTTSEQYSTNTYLQRIRFEVHIGDLNLHQAIHWSVMNSVLDKWAEKWSFALCVLPVFLNSRHVWPNRDELSQCRVVGLEQFWHFEERSSPTPWKRRQEHGQWLPRLGVKQCSRRSEARSQINQHGVCSNHAKTLFPKPCHWVYLKVIKCTLGTMFPLSVASSSFDLSEFFCA